MRVFRKEAREKAFEFLWATYFKHSLHEEVEEYLWSGEWSRAYDVLTDYLLEGIIEDALENSTVDDGLQPNLFGGTE